MPVRDRRYENIMQFIFGAMLWLAVLYLFALAIERGIHYLITLYFHQKP